MNNLEILRWLGNGPVEYFKKDLPKTVDGVRIYLSDGISVAFYYGNARGLVFPDSGVNWNKPDDSKDRYYPLLKLSCQYSDECKFNPHCIPLSLDAVAEAVKKSWELFTKG